MTIDLATAIDDFWAARKRGEIFPAAYFDRLTIDDAYRIQLAQIDRRVAAGERQIGWKLGLTSRAIQEQFGWYEPQFACIMETQPSGHLFGATELIQPGFETELCMRLGRGLEGQVDLQQVRAAIDVIHPSFEIIEKRGPVKQVALVLADNGQQRSVVIGAPLPLASDIDPARVTVRVQLNGQEVATGFGSAVLGNPLNSIQWLAAKLIEYGRSLRPGDIVMTGSFVRQFALHPGDAAVAEFSGFGRVEVGIAKLE